MKTHVKAILWDTDVRDYVTPRVDGNSITILVGTVAFLNGSFTDEECLEHLTPYWGAFWSKEMLKLRRISKCEVLERIVSYVHPRPDCNPAGEGKKI